MAQFNVTKNKILKEEVWEKTDKCGLPVYVIPKKGFLNKTAMVGVKFGSVDLHFHPRTSPQEKYSSPEGTAHFLEHQLFKKEKYDIFEVFGRYGASSNAYTSFVVTSYFFTCTDNFEKNLEVLLELAYKPVFKDEFVNKEQPIIQQEIKMHNDIPDLKVFLNLMSILFQKHPVRHDPEGSIESISRITADTLKKNYSTFYHPANTVLVCSGDIDPKTVFNMVEKAFANSPKGKGAAIKRIVPEEPPEASQKLITARASIPRKKCLMGFKEIKTEDDPRKLYLRELHSEIALHLLFGKVSKFFDRCYQAGIIDDSFSALYFCHKTFGLAGIGGDTDNPEKMTDAVFKEIKKARKNGFKKHDVERVRREYTGKFLRSFDSPYKCASVFHNYILNDVNVFEFPGLLKKINRKSLQERIEELLDEKSHAVSIVEPANGI